jgi:hypothetical protein
MIAIIPAWVKLGSLLSYQQGSVRPENAQGARDDNPLDSLVDFSEIHLRSRKDALIVCDNPASASKTIGIWTWSIPPRFMHYGHQDALYVLESATTSRETIDASLADSLGGKWGLAVCSSSRCVPSGESATEAFIDNVVKNTVHVLMPAFDGDGYVIWTTGRTA